ncbi:MAG: hypothetical protein PUH11_05065 [Bacilli bacterium]|nr:hypothetical protein [Bacilli bacterium]MDY4052717.1 hypothetical protein [Bacilli bacterium]
MKYFIYIKNTKNEFLGVYQLINEDGLKPLNPKLINNTKNKIYTSSENNNYNLKLLSILYTSLNEKKLELKQFKCIGRKKDNVYYLIRLGNATSDLTLSSFAKVNEKHQKVIKVYDNYKKKINKEKNKAVMNAIFAELRFNDYFVLSVEIIIFITSLFLVFVNNPLKGGITPLILLLSIFILLLQSLEKIVTKISKGLEFKKNCRLSTKIEGESKTKILEEVIDPMTFSSKYKNYQVMKFPKINEAFIFSSFENKNFDSSATNLEVELSKDVISLSESSRKALAYIIATKLTEDKTIFNGKLLGINSELNFTILNKVEVKKVRYHNYVSTDEMIFQNIVIPTDSSNVISGKALTLNPLTNGLMDIENSHLTNLIGINLMVELEYNNTKYYVINQQSMYNDVNSSRYSPSASGSLDLNDYYTLKKHHLNSFKELLAIGMLRELSEESYIFMDINKVEDITLLGFSRLVSKAGKPDFFGKINIKVNSEEELTNIIDNYTTYQNQYLGSKKHELEGNQMVIISREDLFNENLLKDELSPQLQYLIYLLKNE